MTDDQAKSPPEEAEIHALALVMRRLSYMGMWDVVDWDHMRGADAYVIYLRSILKHRFRNAVGEVVRDHFDAWIQITANIIRHSPQDAVNLIRSEASNELDDAKRCV